MGNRLYVGNLSFNTTESTIKFTFVEVGEVREVAGPIDRETGRGRGLVFVTMENEGDANTAIERLNGLMVDGRPIRVNEAQERPPRGGGGGGAPCGGHRGW